MSDRIKGLTVIFKKPLKDEDAERFKSAIEMFAEVAKVEMKITEGIELEMAKFQLREKLWEALK